MAYLASPALGGRAAGSPGSAQAAVFIARRYTELGIPGAFPGRCDAAPPCPPLFAQSFRVESGSASNIAAVLPGADSLLRSTWIVIGAHRDHIGRTAQYARDPERGMLVRPGADDNASGTAAVLELARRFKQRPPPRSVMFVHFDAEEQGLLGSRVFVSEPPMSLDSVMVMINFDMVGRLRKAELTIDVAANGQGFLGLIDSLATTEGIQPLFITGLSSRSDHGPFDESMVPAFALFTGFHADYHTANDIAAKVDAAGILKIVDLVENLVRSAGPRL